MSRRDGFQTFGIAGIVYTGTTATETGHAFFQARLKLVMLALDMVALGMMMRLLRGGANGGAAPTDVGDVTFFARVEAYVVAQTDLSGYGHIKPAEQVGEGVLEREGYGEAADAEGGEERGDGDVEVVQDAESSQDENENLREVPGEAGDGQVASEAAAIETHHVAGEARHHEGEGEYPQDGRE